MIPHVWYVTKFLQVSAGIAVTVGATVMITPHFSSTGETKRVRATVQRKEIKALPVSLPQGRLFCVKGVLMHERMYPKGFEQISPSDAVEVASTVADEACANSHRSSACKEAQADLTSLRRALRSCNP
jgi:hypothetical protein